MAKPFRSPFIGREQELRQYQEFLGGVSPWLLVIAAVGGSGKTMLLNKLSDLTPPNFIKVTLDFASEVSNVDEGGKQQPIDPLTLLEDFVNFSEVKYICDPQKLQAFNVEMKIARNLFANYKPPLIEHMTNIQEVKLTDSEMQHNRVSMNMFEDPALQKIRREARQMVTKAFFALMDTIEANHLVIMLDTCEWLNETLNVEIGMWIVKEFLFSLYKSMRLKNKFCHVVMVGSVIPPQFIAVKKEETIKSLS